MIVFPSVHLLFYSGAQTEKKSYNDFEVNLDSGS